MDTQQRILGSALLGSQDRVLGVVEGKQEVSGLETVEERLWGGEGGVEAWLVERRGYI